ncbi:TrbI/VirB10 family protein [Crocosphaera chwakensis]|uniref:Uncharacterized protein n=1 Tax=Crocosphaera chwakensis CCY0110 TaxID=391612 RepID=A3IXB6_9CHRO|nr:TrbI/VirB10 family protein [Crocosphaera chwakensis]EAZ88859.1 hypothetical protein CY0110_31235 [Crocosphaera chwakensis CCY0110]
MNSSQNYSTEDIYNLLELSNTQLDSTQVPNPEASLTNILTEEMADDSSQENQKKPKSFAKNPYAKLGLITLVVGAFAVFLGLLFSQGNSIYSSFSNNSTSTSNSPESQQTENALEQPDSLEERNAKLSGELALADQNDQIKAIKDQLDNGQDVPTVTVEKPEVSTTPTPTVVRTRVPPTPVRQAQPARSVSRVVSHSRPVSQTRPTSPQPQPSTSTQQTDPIQQWQQLAQLGSYGSGQQVNQRLSMKKDANHEIQELDTPETTLVAQSIGLSLPLGQKVSGVLSTPIAVPVDQRNTTNFAFMVTLSEPLTSHQNETVLKQGSTVIFAVDSVQSGIISSRPVAVISDGQEYPLQGESLQIRLSNGSPLIAKLKDNYSGNIARRDGATFLMGALSQVGELANRASSTSTFSGLGGVSSTSTYNEPNYVGAILEGGLTPISEQWQQRNQQAISEMQNLSRLWWLDAGIEVQIWVTRSVELGEVHAQNP